MRALEPLATEAGEQALLARAYVGLAVSTYDTGADLHSAQELLTRAGDLASRSGAGAVRAAIRGQEALLLLRSGRIDEAVAAFDRAVELIDQAEPRDRIRILCNRGALALELGRLDRARADLSGGARLAAAEGDLLTESMVRHNLGYVEFLAGNLPRALAEMSDAADLVPGGRTAVFYLDRARVLREAGLLRDADSALAAAAAEFRRDRRGQELAEVALLRAECALTEGDPARARRLARDAASRFRRRRNVLWQRRAEMVALRCEQALARSSRRRLAGLAARIEAFVAEVEGEGRVDLAETARLLYADCALAAGVEVPGDLLDRVARLRPDDTFRMRLERREVRTRRALAAGDPAVARREIRRGLAELTDHRAHFDSIDLRTASAVHGLRLASLGIGLAAGTGRADALFETIERARAVLTRVPGVQGPTDVAGAELLGALRRAEEESRELIGDPARVADRARLRDQVADLQRRIRARGWERDGVPLVVHRPAAYGDVREAVRADGLTLVSLVSHQGRLVSVELGGRRATTRELGGLVPVAESIRRVRADLDALALPGVPDGIAASIRGSLADGLARLDDALLAGAGAGGPLVVAAGGAFSAVPWSLLPSRRGLPTEVAPSATMWWRARQEGTRPAAPSLAAVAGPGLARADDEVRRVASAWDAVGHHEVLTGELATADRVRAALGDHDVVHVAAHGLHQSQSPLFSSLRLAGGPLFAYELEAERLAAECVLVSACEAGLVSVRPGDQPLGLASVLLQLGIRNVVAGVANVADDAACRVMEDVHRRMAAGADSAAALAASQAAWDGPPAPFVCFGSGW